MKVTRHEQLEGFSRVKHRAAMRVLFHMHQRLDHVVELAERRAFGKAGIDVYGDAAYHVSPEQNEYELDCELADAVFYAHIPLLELPILGS